jgi:GntR family transcriptional regulator, galactonate operon transcriptional repressor
MTSPLHPGHLSLPEQVATVLGQRIVHGLYAPGDILPGTDELIGEFGVSRPVIREAMKILHSKGLVESRQKVGTWARARQHWAMLDRDVLGWQLADPESNLSLLGSLVEVRRIVEPAASRLAAERATPADVETMRNALRDMRTALEDDNRQGYIEADMRFHTGILVASHNLLLLQMDAVMGSALRVTREVTASVQRSSHEALPLHERLLDRISAGSGLTAAQAAEWLIDRAETDIATALNVPDLSVWHDMQGNSPAGSTPAQA